MKQAFVLHSPALLAASSYGPWPIFQSAYQGGGITHVTFTKMNAFVDLNTASALSGRERRKLRNERREDKCGNNWREEVEEKLATKVKKQYTPKSAELNLDRLAVLGAQWWIVRVPRKTGDETAHRIAKQLAKNFPQLQFKVYAPSIQFKTKLKNGTYSSKSKPAFPGCAFLYCVMDKSVHDAVRECEGVGGFIGAKVAFSKRIQITKPKPVEPERMEEVFRQAKEEQENHDRAFQEEEKQSREILLPNSPKKRALTAGSPVRILSGNFAQFRGTVTKVNRRTGKVGVSLTLLGKEIIVELDSGDVSPDI